MIEIRIPKEIRTYKEKLFFGLNLRQLICTLIAIIINVPLYWFGKDYVGSDAASWIVIFIAMPLFMIGYFNYNGMTFEQFIKSVIQQELIYPQKRKYVTINMFELLVSIKEKGEQDSAIVSKQRKKIKEKGSHS